MVLEVVKVVWHCCTVFIDESKQILLKGEVLLRLLVVSRRKRQRP